MTRPDRRTGSVRWRTPRTRARACPPAEQRTGSTRDLGVRPALPCPPAIGCVVPALRRENPDPAEPELVGDPVGVIGIDLLVGSGVARDQSGVVRRRRKEDTWAEVSRLDPVIPRNPRWCENGVRAGEQDALVDGDDLGS
jgi:hypothetical protein